MIVSASRRTDIPAFFSEWFIRRLRDGFVLVRNPMNAHQVSRIILSPRVVDCIVFWTKNPRPMLCQLPALQPYNFYFQYTINPYGKTLEPNVPSTETAVSLFKDLSRQVGSERVIWRYDPIIFTNQFTPEIHLAAFSRIAQDLAKYTRKCVISFVDLYKKCERNLSSVPLVTIEDPQIIDFCQGLQRVARPLGIEINTCAEEVDLSAIGIAPGKCIDDKLIEEIAGLPLRVSKDSYQRAECGCVASVDVGSYNTCPHGCLYCYANYSAEAVRANYALHDPDSPLLFGTVSELDRITDRKVRSCFETQPRLF